MEEATLSDADYIKMDDVGFATIDEEEVDHRDSIVSRNHAKSTLRQTIRYVSIHIIDLYLVLNMVLLYTFIINHVYNTTYTQRGW